MLWLKHYYKKWQPITQIKSRRYPILVCYRRVGNQRVELHSLTHCAGAVSKETSYSSRYLLFPWPFLWRRFAPQQPERGRPSRWWGGDIRHLSLERWRDGRFSPRLNHRAVVWGAARLHVQCYQRSEREVWWSVSERLLITAELASFLQQYYCISRCLHM